MVWLLDWSHSTGVYIYGLFLQGAAWSRKKGMIAESKRGELFFEMPLIWLEPINVDEPLPSDTYPCPVYKTSVRAGELSTTGHSTNFVLFLRMNLGMNGYFYYLLIFLGDLNSSLTLLSVYFMYYTMHIHTYMYK